jgi:hypothetical protein
VINKPYIEKAEANGRHGKPLCNLSFQISSPFHLFLPLNLKAPEKEAFILKGSFLLLRICRSALSAIQVIYEKVSYFDSCLGTLSAKNNLDSVFFFLNSKKRQISLGSLFSWIYFGHQVRTELEDRNQVL